jgi:hypothetical protein
MSSDKSTPPRTRVTITVDITTVVLPGTNTYGDKIGERRDSGESFTVAGDSAGEAITKAHAFLSILDPHTGVKTS